MKFSCPACGADVIFKTRTAVFGVCSYCQSMLVRHDLNLEDMGKMTMPPQDMSPLQIGTTGVYDKIPFEIVGKQRLKWDSGFWNEWYVLLQDGHTAWLGEAQGHYMMSFHVETGSVPNLKNLRPETSVKMYDNEYTVRDIKEVVCVGALGELPLKSYKGRLSTSVDFSGDENKFASIDYGQEETRLYIGRYVEFEDLQFKNLREIDGW